MEIPVFSLWLVPDGKTRENLTRTIKQLAATHNAPSFDPHITLVGAVQESENEILDKTRRLAVSLAPLEITLGEVEYTEQFYRSIYSRVKLTSYLKNAHKTAADFFPKLLQEDFMPHLSLLYSTEVSKEEKQAIKPDLESEIKGIFVARTLRLQLTDGEVSTWKAIEDFNLIAND